MVVGWEKVEYGQECSEGLRGQLLRAARDSNTDTSTLSLVSFDWRRIMKSHKAWGIFRNCKDFPPRLSPDALFTKTCPH